MIRVDVRQKPTQYCKVIILQLKTNKKKRNQSPWVEFWGTNFGVEERKKQVKEAKRHGSGGRKKQRDVLEEDKERDFHIKDLGQPDVSFPLCFQSE